MEKNKKQNIILAVSLFTSALIITNIVIGLYDRNKRIKAEKESV